MGHPTKSEQLLQIAFANPMPANEQIATFKDLFFESLIKRQRLLQAIHIAFEFYFLIKHTMCVKEGNITLVTLLETLSTSKFIFINFVPYMVEWQERQIPSVLSTGTRESLIHIPYLAFGSHSGW